MTSHQDFMHTGKSKKLPARYNRILMPLFLSVLMSCLVAGISTVQNTGMSPDLLANWMKAWGASWVVAFPSLFVVLPIVRRLVSVFVEPFP